MAPPTLTELGTSLYSSANAATYTCPAAGGVTPAASCGIVVIVETDDTGGAPVPSLDSPTWLDGSWTQEATSLSADENFRLTIFSGKSVASPGSDNLTVTPGGTPIGASIVIIQVTGQHATDFVLQPAASTIPLSSTSATVTLAGALANADSVHLAAFVLIANNDMSPAGSETPLTVGSHTSPARRVESQYIVNSTTNGVTFSTSSGAKAGMEIAAQVSTFVPRIIEYVS